MTNNFHHLKSGIKIFFLSLGLEYQRIQIVGPEFLQRCGHQIRVNSYIGSNKSDYPPIYPSRGEHAQGPTSWKLKEHFFLIFYRVCLHGIDLYGFCQEIIEFQHSKSITTSKFQHKLHLVLQPDIYKILHFLINCGCVHYLSYATLISFVASQGDML